tara:strand:+ start:8660 stop:9943 length:1284 start_codon:yes stop_codon:yes gene_type:complete
MRYFLFFITIFSFQYSWAFKSACGEYLFKTQPTEAEYREQAFEEFIREGKLPEFKQGIRKLKGLNDQLETTNLKLEDLFKEGYIEIHKEPLDEFIPYHRIVLKKIGVTILAPTTPPTSMHQNPMMFIPGAGTMRSNGRSVTSVAGTFTKLKGSRAELGDELINGRMEKGFRGWAYIFDPPGNAGYSRRAPEYLSTADGMLMAMRHAHLVMDVFMRDRYHFEGPLIVAGRSMGALQAAAYAHKYGLQDGVLAGIAISTQPNDLVNVITTMERHRPDGEATAQVQLGGMSLDLDHRTLYTAAVQSTKYRMNGLSKSPILFMQSMLDPSYDMNLYKVFLDNLKSADPLNHQIHILPDSLRANHDLWDKPDRDADIKRFANRKREQQGEIAADEYVSEQLWKKAVFEHTLKVMVGFISHVKRQTNDNFEPN